MQNLTFSEAIGALSKMSANIAADRQAGKSFQIAEKCKISFADCSVLDIEEMQMQGNMKQCNINNQCRIPKSLSRIRKWCKPQL
eukprot:m.148137 g.148137  ORF g.148137 m.148137 type:complete len:84 (+) comp38490_c1_seq16:3344-3595(+)